MSPSDCAPVAVVIDALGRVELRCDFASASLPSDCIQAAAYAQERVRELLLLDVPATCTDGDACERAYVLTMATVTMAVECLDLKPIMALASGTRVNVAATCADAVTLLRGIEPMVQACVDGTNTTCNTALTAAAQVVASATGCLGAILTEAGVPTILAKDLAGDNGICASAARAVKSTVNGVVVTVQECLARTQPQCKTLLDTAVAAAGLVSGCIFDTAKAFGFEVMLIAEPPGVPVCAGAATKAATTINDTIAFVQSCVAGTDGTCNSATRTAAGLVDGVVACLGQVAKVAGVAVATPEDTLTCGKRIAALLDLHLSVLGVECLGGSPNTYVDAPASQYQQALEDTLRSTDVAGEKDEEELAAVPEFFGVSVAVLDCVDAMFAVNPFNLGVTHNGDSLWTANALLMQEDRQGSGNSDVPPQLQNLKSQPLNGYAGDEYGGNVKGGKGTNVGAVYRIYDAAARDHRGRVLIMWQNADLSVSDDDNIKFTKAIAVTHHEAGFAHFLAASPEGERRIESTQGVTVSAKGSIKKGKDGPSTEVGASRTFGVRHTVFGGNRARSDDGRTYAHLGGFRKIARGYRHEGRVWASAAGWVFPPKQHQGFQIGLMYEYVK